MVEEGKKSVCLFVFRLESTDQMAAAISPIVRTDPRANPSDMRDAIGGRARSFRSHPSMYLASIMQIMMEPMRIYARPARISNDCTMSPAAHDFLALLVKRISHSNFRGSTRRSQRLLSARCKQNRSSRKFHGNSDGTSLVLNKSFS